MKKSTMVVASMAGALSASAFPSNSKTQISHESGNDDHESQRSPAEEKFQPRFDGLRFIETLVTAHR